jgi:hypothetical protein
MKVALSLRRFALRVLASSLASAVLVAGLAAASPPPTGDESAAALFASAGAALHEGRAGDAIAELESLADRGVLDPVLSYDRGLAYAMRVRIGAEVPGDLGRAAHGFEEARDLTRDGRLAEEASRALVVIRSEVARRRTRAGETVEVDPGRSLARAVAGLLSEDAWAIFAAVSSGALALGLFVRWLSDKARWRIGGAVAAGAALPLLVVSVAMALASRHDRYSLREAVIVSESARPADARGIVVPGGSPLPEGARVEVTDARPAWTRVRFGALETWVASSALRVLARRD